MEDLEYEVTLPAGIVPLIECQSVADIVRLAYFATNSKLPENDQVDHSLRKLSVKYGEAVLYSS